MDSNDTVNKRMTCTVAAAVVSAVMLMVSVSLVGLNEVIRFIPVLAVLPVTVYVLTNNVNRTVNPKRLMNDAPAAVGMMAIKILSGGSLDSAVRGVASSGPKHMSKLFSGIVKNVDLRIIPDMKTAISNAMSELHKDLTSFKRSMYMLMAASESDNDEEKKRMIKDAESTILAGLKEMGETYGASLNSPCMMIFGLGVMVPMILMSIVPMLSVGGMFSVSILDTSAISLITLAAIPGITAIVVASVISGDPFADSEWNRNDVIYLIPFAAMVPMFFVIRMYVADVTEAILMSAVPLGVAAFILMSPRMNLEKRSKKTDMILNQMLFDIGNRLTAGDNFEIAMVSALAERKESQLSASIRRSVIFSRGDITEVLRSSLSSYSKEMADAYVRVYEASLKDVREAGRLAIGLGHQIQDRTSVRKRMENKLKSMNDMMTGTAAMFAPLIMGLSIVLLKPLSSISGAASLGDVSSILSIYLIELAILISVLTAYLGKKGGVVNAAYRFSIIMPISLIAFTMFSGLSI